MDRVSQSGVVGPRGRSGSRSISVAPMRRLVIVLLAAASLLAVPAAAPATARAATLKPCAGLRDAEEGKIFRVRLSRGFSCRDARTNLGSWLGFGAPMTVGRPDIPGGWRCSGPSSFGTYIRYICRLTTSFGGTKPERTYRLVYRYDPYVGPR